MKPKLIVFKDGTAILQGKVCPFRNPLVLPSATIAGQLTIENIPCSNACPLFSEFLFEGGKNYVALHCGTLLRTFDVDVIKDNETKSNLTIV